MKLKSHRPRLLITADTMGGVWNYSLDLIRALGSDYDVLLASQGQPPSPQQCRQVAALPNVVWSHRQYALEWMDEPWSDLEAAGEWLMRCQEEINPDVVHLNSFCHASLPWRVPTVLVAHSCVRTWWRAVKGEAAPARYEKYRSLVEQGLNAAKVVVFPTLALQHAFEREYEIRESQKRVIWNGCDPRRYQKGNKSPLIFSAGRLWDQSKNMALLNSIAPKLAWPVQIAGSNTSPWGLAESLPNLEWLGTLPEKPMAEQLKVSSIYAAPALYEPFGLAVLEAAMSGCALVLADIPTLRELWQDAGMFVPPTNERKWIETLNSVASQPALRNEMAERAMRRSKLYSASLFASNYHDLYAELIAQTVIPRARAQL